MYTNDFFFYTLLRILENSFMKVDNRPLFDLGGLYIFPMMIVLLVLVIWAISRKSLSDRRNHC